MTYYLITERRLGGCDSRWERTVIPLRSHADQFVIQNALIAGALKTRPGVRAWTEARST